MTHTLLRTGDIESQKGEFCWLVYQTPGLNDNDFVNKARAYISIVESVDGDNWGETKIGSVLQVGSEAIKAGLKENSRIRGVFSRRDQAVEFLQNVVAKKPGLSVLIAGVLPEIAEICAEVGIVPHSANFSLGVWGRKDKLPDEKTLSITTMCGHHTIPAKFVESVREEVDSAVITPEEGAKKLAAFCYCGVFNPVRCADLLRT